MFHEEIHKIRKIPNHEHDQHFVNKSYRNMGESHSFQNQNVISEIISIEPVRDRFTSPHYRWLTFGQGKRLEIHGFSRTLTFFRRILHMIVMILNIILI